jgi:hypothetical protein
MMKAGNIAMAVRHQAGIDRGELAGAMASAAPLSENDRIQFAEMKVAAASPWSVILGAAKSPAFPAPVGKAVQQAQKIYFTDQMGERDAILAQLDRGRRPSLSAADWTQRSNRGLSAVTNVSRVAFEQAKIHLREQTGQAQRRFIGALILLVIVATSSGSVRDWWARHLGDITSGSRAADFVIGLVVGLLPLIGVVLGAVRTRGPRRIFRMFVYGGTGFVITYLIAPSPGRYLADHESTHIFDREVPDYLPGVFTGVCIWVVAIILGALRARRWWRGVKSRFGVGAPRDRDDRTDKPRVIDI